MELMANARQGLNALPSKELQHLLLKAFERENIKTVNHIEVSPGSLLGDNFMGVIHRIKIQGLASDGALYDKSMIIKCMPNNQARCEFFSVTLLFRNETNFYEQVIPGLQDGTLLSIAVPRCFSSICNGKNDAVVLEDLRLIGYRMRQRDLGLDKPHIRLVLRELAKLHALSLSLRSRNTQKFADLSKYVKDLFFDADRKAAFEPFITSSYEETFRIIYKHYDCNNDNLYVRAMKKLAEAGYELIAGIVRGTQEHEKVITHGDCWTNNLQFRYDNNETPVDVRFLDFQLPRVTSPAIDLTYVLFTSMRHDIMTKCYDELLKEYHLSLDKFLSEMGLSASQVFPRSRLDQEMARCAPYGMAMAGIVVPAVYCPPDQAPNLEAVTENTADAFVQEYAKQMKADTKQGREQLAAILQHCVDRGFFNHII